MKRVILLVGILFSASLSFAQVYASGVPVEPVGWFPWLIPTATTPMIELPSPSTAGLAIVSGESAPVWYGTRFGHGDGAGARNATDGNQAGARNSSIGFRLRQAQRPAFERREATGAFNTGAAVYAGVSADLRSVGDAAAELRQKPKPPARVYTNDDISRLKQPQEGSTLAPQTTTPTKKQ